MSILSEQERDGLEDIFLSISKTRLSPFKWSLYHSPYSWVLKLSKSFFLFCNDCFKPQKEQKVSKMDNFAKELPKSRKTQINLS